MSMIQRLYAREAGPPTNSLLPTIVTFDVLQVVGLVLILLTLLPALLSRSVIRIKSWVTLMLSCLVYGASFLLLVGNQATDKDPSLALCLIQSGLIYAAPPLCAAACLVFVIELHLRLSATLQGAECKESTIYWLLWILPLTHTVLFWFAVISGLSDLETIERSDANLFCHVNQSAPTLTTGATCVAFLAAMMILEGYTGVLLWRRKLFIQNMTLQGDHFPLRLFIRTAIYTSVGGLGIMMAVILINTANTFSTLLMLPLGPISLACCFGSQLDILRVYFSWTPSTQNYRESNHTAMTHVRKRLGWPKDSAPPKETV
jgi:hypothetical protein